MKRLYVVCIGLSFCLGVAILYTVTNKQEPLPTATYRDGAYHATSTYQTPLRKMHTIGVHTYIERGVIEAISVRYDNQLIDSTTITNDSSSQYHRRFESRYKDQVIGKSLSAIPKERIGGASLTTIAFNDALAQISQQAQ